MDLNEQWQILSSAIASLNRAISAMQTERDNVKHKRDKMCQCETCEGVFLRSDDMIAINCMEDCGKCITWYCSACYLKGEYETYRCHYDR
jgi:hypothetical protein